MPLNNQEGFPPSDDFYSTLGEGSNAGLAISAGVYVNGQALSGYQGLLLEGITLSADRANQARTTATATIVLDPSNNYFPAPTDINSPLAPNGNEIVLTAGFTYEDGSTENFILGIFPIVTVNTVAQAGGDTVLSITLDDRSYSFSRRGLLQQASVTTGTTVDQAILQLLQANDSGLPPIGFSIQTTDVPAAPNVYDQGQDPFEAGLELANAIGFELFINQAGNVVSAPIPIPGATPNWSYSDGSDGNPRNIISANRTLTQEDVYNDVYVATANTTQIVNYYEDASASVTQAFEYWDGDSSSPTYIGGPFGRIPEFINSTVSNTIQAAQVETELDFNQSLGQVDTIALEGVLNAAVQIDDVVQVTCLRIGLSQQLYVVDGYNSTFQIGGTTTMNLRRIIAVNDAYNGEIDLPEVA